MNIERDENRVPTPLTYGLWHAIQRIYSDFGDVVSIDQKAKVLYKFGRNPDTNAATYETLWSQGGDETYIGTNAITHISSSDNGDTQDMVIEGHTISGGELTFVSQTVTLVGQTKTALTTPLARVNRGYNDNSVDLAGDVYVYEDDTVTAGVPQTASKIHLKVILGGNQSEKCATSISNTDYLIITSFSGYCFDKTAEIVEFIGELRQVGTTNKVFRRVFSTAGANGNPTVIYFDPPFIVPKNYDLRVRAKSAGVADVGASFNGYLAKVI